MGCRSIFRKLYHTLGCLGDATAWEKARTYFEGVKGKYDLEPKFSNLFVDKIKGSKESIFQLGFQVNGELSSFNRGSWVFNPAASSYGKSFHRVKCTKAFYDFLREPISEILVLKLHLWQNGENVQTMSDL